MNPESPDFMYSNNLWKVAERQGFWKKSDGLLDFTKTYAGVRLHPTYSTRRVWRVFNLVAPNLILPAHTDALANDYPFSVKPEKLLTPQDLMTIQRDHYEGTEFDLTKEPQVLCSLRLRARRNSFKFYRIMQMLNSSNRPIGLVSTVLYMTSNLWYQLSLKIKVSDIVYASKCMMRVK